MASPREVVRTRAYGQDLRLSTVDRAGVWLSSRQIWRAVGNFAGKRVGDFGCGYEAVFSSGLLGTVQELVLVDIALAPRLIADERVRGILGTLPEALEGLLDGSLDVVICNSVLEHLWEPGKCVAEFWRVLAPGGLCFINVPSWRGKRWLELSAFRLGLSPSDEMDDHMMYYDPQQLWPLLVRGGFRPSQIRVSRHKLGLNTLAVCRKS